MLNFRVANIISIINKNDKNSNKDAANTDTGLGNDGKRLLRILLLFLLKFFYVIELFSI